MTVTGKRVRVTGCVQAVGYRYFCLKQAAALSICGRAENKSDGSVEIVAVGEPSALETFLAALRQGPHHAEVESVDTRVLEQTQIELISASGGFEIV